MLFLLLASTLTLAFKIQPVKAVGGTIYIKADGSVDPPTAPIQRNGDLYTLTGNINSDTDGIVIERNNIIVDGNGYAVQEMGISPDSYSKGIDLPERKNVTIRNMEIKGFYYGISLYYSLSNVISGNNIAGRYCSLFLTCSSDNIISRNNVTDSGMHEYGIYLLDFSSSNNVSENHITSRGLYSIWLAYSSSNNRISGNKIEESHTGIELQSDSNNNSISRNEIANCAIGIHLIYVSNNSISGNNIIDSLFGVVLSEYSTTNNKVFHNNFMKNAVQARVEGLSISGNVWDDGYPSGGNYWSDYTGSDANKDGIGDTPYVIDVNNQDRYPLMKPWGSTREEWSFAIITDLHIGWGWDLPDYGVDSFADDDTGQDYWLTDRLTNIVKWINNNPQIRFVVVLGDIADTAEYSEFLKARKILNELNIPYIPVIGNHDVWPYTVKDRPFDPDLTRWNKEYRLELNDYGDYYFNKVFWEENVENLQKINEVFGSSWRKQYSEFHRLQDTGQMALLQNYVFTYKGVKFISLDLVDRKLDSSGPRLYSETKTWLSENLKGADPIILLSHHPIGSEVQEIGDAIHSGIRVKANFAGHNHKNDEDTTTWLYWDYAVSMKEITTEAVCRESIWYDPLVSRTGDNIRIVTMFGEEIENYKTFGNIGDETMTRLRWMFRSKSPVDLTVTDPEGITITKELGEVPGMFYSEFDLDSDGKLDDLIVLQELKIGDYYVTVLPESDASLADTYTLEFLGINVNITLAENVQIANIPAKPYILRSTETEIVSLQPATVDFDPDTLNLKSKGKWVTVYIELPLGHGYNISMTNLTSVTLDGQIYAEAKPLEIGDYDSDGIPDLMVKFNRAAVQAVLQVGDQVEITINGKLTDGSLFEGKDTIQVILPP